MLVAACVVEDLLLPLGAFPVPLALSIARQFAEGLGAAHASGLFTVFYFICGLSTGGSQCGIGGAASRGCPIGRTGSACSGNSMVVFMMYT